MLKRPFCGMAISFLMGILVATYPECNRIVWIAFFLGVSLIVYLAKYMDGNTWQLRIRIIACAWMVVLGNQTYAREQDIRAGYLTNLSNGMEVTVQGEVTGKQLRNHQYIYELTFCYIGSYQNLIDTQETILDNQWIGCNRILAYSDSDIVSIGEILILNGTIELWENATNEGSFDEESFYLARKIDFKLKDITVLKKHGEASQWKEKLFQIKLRVMSVYEALMSAEACGVMTTMVLGDKSMLDTETKRLYQSAGLSHMMAISGLHISVIGMTLYQFMRKRGQGFWLSGIAAGFLLYGYGVMVGMSTSVQRSVGMFAILLVAQALGRAYDSLNALGIMALILLWDNPYLLWDAGFQFSFLAIVGVVWVGNCVSFEGHSYAEMKEKVFRGMTVQLTTLPLVAWHYYEAPLYAMLINLLVLPFVGKVLMLGISGGLIGLFSMRGAASILFFAEKMLGVIRGLCALCEKLPRHMQIVGRPQLWQLVCYYVLLFGFTVVAYRRKEKENKEKKKEGQANKFSVDAKKWRDAVRRATIIACLFFLLTVRTNQGFELDFLDVGQGDGIFLRTEQGHTVFIDGGSSSESGIGTYCILPFLKYNGVQQIDFWFVSHADKDHISGLREVLAAGYEIRNLVFADGIIEDTAYEELCALAEENDTKIIHTSAGDTLHLGNAKIHVLYPQSDDIGFAFLPDEKSEDVDKNAYSMVLWYEEEEFSALFTGDIGREQEKELCRTIENAYKNGQIKDVSLEVYKAAHHGSKYSNSEELLELLQPKMSVVSCAKKNSYGHPSAEAIANMQEVGSEIFYTMESGQVKVVKSDGGTEVEVRSWRFSD